ncbi:MAG: hypothetical protein M3Q42_14370 [Pseudomonadota bacterium]|nr:hypothetical protein [Pseudomonadota bacterium]
MSANRRNPTTIAPFWERLGSFIRYPLRGDALVVLLVISFGQVLALVPLIGWIISLFLLAMGYKYAFTILRETAHGRLDPPGGVMEAPDAVVIKFLAIYVVLVLVVVIVAGLAGPAAAILAAVALMVVVPAATMSLAMDESLANALNPSTWLKIIGRLGAPYFLLVGLLAVFQLSAANATDLAARVLPPVVSDVVFAMILFWGVFGTFHLMGYLLYQYHERFGFEPEAHAHALHRPESQDAVLLADSEALIRDGKVEQAVALLAETIGQRAVSVEVHERYRRMLRQQDTTDGLQKHAAMFLNLLMLEGDHRKALPLARESLAVDPTFAPLIPEQGLELARRAASQGQARLAIDLLASIRQAFPRDRMRPEWAMMEADLLLQRGDGDAQAREALVGARERCDDPDQQRKLDALLVAVPG